VDDSRHFRHHRHGRGLHFTTNYVAVGDVATVAGLSAFGFFLGPFVYFGHEKAWDYFGSR
jgi:hypothetical protein